MPTEMQHINNNFFRCPRCGVIKRYTTTATAHFYSMGRFMANVKMECPCIEKETEQEAANRPKRFVIQKRPDKWFDIYDRETNTTINDQVLTEPEALQMAEKMNS